MQFNRYEKHVRIEAGASKTKGRFNTMETIDTIDPLIVHPI